MKISEIIPVGKIIPELKAINKINVIEELLDLFKNDERVYDIDALKNDIFKREKIMSTGIGDGLAIPHCTTNVVKDYIAAFGKTSRDIDFESVDHKPAHIFFLVAGNNVNQHMQMLGRIARLMNDKLKEELLKAGTPEEIHAIFREFDKNYDL